MNTLNLRNYITSYPYPDTDGVACAITLASFLFHTTGEKWLPFLLGDINEETRYVLEHLGIPLPSIGDRLPLADKVVLVDTHHQAQLPEGFPYDRVTLIVDHHPYGDDTLFYRAKIINEAVGAAATLIARMYGKKEIEDQKMLSLLGFGILSNTLNFSAPSTTLLDRQVFTEISSLGGIDKEAIGEMFSRRVLAEDILEALSSDFKVFDTPYGKVGISQLEIYDLIKSLDRVKVKGALQMIGKEKELDYCFFNGVDIREGKSVVICADERSAHLVGTVFEIPYRKGVYTFDRILLRKTDFIPKLNR